MVGLGRGEANGGVDTVVEGSYFDGWDLVADGGMTPGPDDYDGCQHRRPGS